jgi:hypothetical protein
VAALNCQGCPLWLLVSTGRYGCANPDGSCAYPPLRDQGAPPVAPVAPVDAAQLGLFDGAVEVEQ